MEQENKQELGSQAELPAQSAAPPVEGGYPFRGAAFGGFQRQDVLDYLKKSQESNRQELCSVKEALDSTRAELEAERQRVRDLERAKDEDERHVTELSHQADSAQTVLMETQEALEQARSEKEALQARAAQLQSELAALRPQAEAYAQLRERTATIELDAHARAQAIVDKARRESAQVRGKYLEWAREMHLEYQELREDVNQTFGNAARELERVGRILERTTGELDIHEEEMRSFLEEVESPEAENTERT